MRGARARHGSALIDVLLAMALLAITGTALVTLLGQTARSMRSVLEAERVARGASEQLSWLAVADRDELAARVGRTKSRGWTVDIRLDSMSVFDVEIAESDTSAPLLRTSLYRPDSTRDTP